MCVICEKQLAHGDLLDQQGCNLKKEKKKEKNHTFHKSQPDQSTLPVANRTQSVFAKYETIFFVDFHIRAFMNVEKFLDF